jgi:hypothetical protein
VPGARSTRRLQPDRSPTSRENRQTAARSNHHFLVVQSTLCLRNQNPYLSLEPEELGIVQKALDRIAEAFTT